MSHDDEGILKTRIANRLAEIRAELSALIIERDALERISTDILLNMDNGRASGGRPISQNDLPLLAGQRSVPTLSGQVMVIMHQYRDAKITRAGLVELASALPALAHIHDKKKSAQTVVGRLINEKSIIELESGALVLPIDVETSNQ